VAEDAGAAPGYGGVKRRVEVANAVVRGDALDSPEAQAHAAEFLPDEEGNVKTSAHDVVHSDGGVFPVEPNPDAVPAVTAEAQHEVEAAEAISPAASSSGSVGKKAGSKS